MDGTGEKYLTASSANALQLAFQSIIKLTFPTSSRLFMTSCFLHPKEKEGALDNSLSPAGRLSSVQFILWPFLFMYLPSFFAHAQSSAQELTSPGLWTAAHVPFSFRYHGVDSQDLLPQWHSSHTSDKDQSRIYSYSDPQSRLIVTAEVRRLSGNPEAIDWVIRFRNDGTMDTALIENILPLNFAVEVPDGLDCYIRHARGSNAAAQDFEPLEERVRPGESDRLESSGGDPSSKNTLPFFNLQTGNHGVIGAIGWTGNWRADFAYRSDGKALVMTAGMKKTHLLLHPGEEIRTPRIVLMRWSGGDWRRAQNTWRQLLLEYYTPHDNGRPIEGPILFGSWGSEPIESKLAYIHWVHENNIPVEVYAVDAGWYGDSFGAENDPTNPWWKNRGDWFPSKRYYPNGIKPLGDTLKAAGLGFSLWIEPETSMPGRKIILDHPGWYLHSDKPVNPGVALANLGDPEVMKGITDMVSGFITEFGMTWYRQDFNIPPERYWELADSPDRTGMTEIRHIEGLYQMWDSLLRMHPGLRIDNCASGGRRIDIEMMSRSFVVWRTDYGFTDTLAEQAQTQALAPWVPENMGFESYTQSAPWAKSGPYATAQNLYLMRLGYNAGYGLNPGVAGINNEDWVAFIKQAIAEYREVQPYFYGNFYPLQPYSLSVSAWTIWQWDRPESKDGVVIALRRPHSPVIAMPLGLQYLDPTSTYQIEIRTAYGKGREFQMTGKELSGFQVKLTDAPASALVFYRRKGL
jgi:alpha-galactosidase